MSPAYFFDDEQARHTIADLRTLDALRKLQVQHVSLRTVLQHKGLSPASQQVIQQMVDRCLELEGLTGRDTGPVPDGVATADGVPAPDAGPTADGVAAEDGQS
ncbi:hypothetical protein [Micromonospora cathayae]|uniref:Uncharacterized protein n=1 Tax=Micromonospora cathayae TaxID=3028804 RepID=A0ABY7ZT49_9ACTN|nr:hypothetical protein [Micromonospora sp. HUAS 3]WDZ86177.1 hypothetical protein PVK37_07100 [Micromonospora sp. HUAS 3]